MGYRSTVAIKCGEAAFKKFEEAYKQYNLFWPDRVYSHPDGEKLIVWDWIKWYSDYECVRAIEKVMAELGCSEYDADEIIDKGLDYAFVRCGEDYEDIERDGNSYTYVGVIMDIDIEDFERVYPEDGVVCRNG